MRRIRSIFSGRARRKRELELVQESGLFDSAWYVRTYPEVDRSGVDPLSHFLESGWRRGHDPGPEFSVAAYLNDNVDVARSGMNPLLHFIEFGIFEGRDAVGPGPSVLRPEAATFEFGAAAAVASFPVEPDPSTVWMRARELNSPNPRANDRTGPSASYADDGAMRQSVGRGFDMLEILSGLGLASGQASHEAVFDNAVEQLIDAWHLNSHELRTRWGGPELPLVIRAYQHDPVVNGGISQVGEGRIVTKLDTLDLRLTNPLFPILFVLSRPNGALRGWKLLVFPSLCRGGLHHSELLASQSGVFAESCRRADYLFRIITGVAGPAVTSVEVELTGSDGRGPLFQQYCRDWFERVLRLEVAPKPFARPTLVGQLLSETIAVRPSVRRPGHRAKLCIGSDMLPTISALTETRSAGLGGDQTEIFLPLLSATPGKAPAAMLIDPSQRSPAVVKDLLSLGRWTWPSLQSSGEPFPTGSGAAGAIQYSRDRKLVEAELYVPISGPGLSHSAAAKSITWLIHPGAWEAEQFAETIAALARQDNSDLSVLALVGAVSRAPRLAYRGFPGRVEHFRTVSHAISAVDTAVTGHIGPNIVLHDNRSSALFARMLDDPRVLTASCVLLDCERRGRHWRADVGDGGVVRSKDPTKATQSSYLAAVEILWRCTYAVARPPVDLWAGRSEVVKSWLQHGAPIQDALHFCTSIVTASRVVRRRSKFSDAFPAMPEAPIDNVTTFEALAG